MHNPPQRHRGTEETVYYHKELTDKLIACAIEVHRHLGPGLLESSYDECYCYELINNGVLIERQKALPLVYKEIKLDCGYRMDMVADNKVVVELKCVEKILPIQCSASDLSQDIRSKSWPHY